MNRFYIPITTKAGTVNCSEITVQQIINITKYIMNSDMKGLSLYLDRMLIENASNETANLIANLNRFEKFKILLTLRTISLGKTITFKNPKNDSDSSRLNYDLSTTLTSIENLEYATETITRDIITVTYGIPNSLFITEDEMLPSMIKVIQISGSDALSFESLDISQKIQIYNTLPSWLQQELFNYSMKCIESTRDIELITRIAVYDIEPLHLNILNDSIIGFLAQIFRRDLHSMYEMQFIFASKMGTGIHELMSLSFAESQILLNLYAEEVRKQNEEHEKSKKNANNSKVPKIPRAPRRYT